MTALNLVLRFLLELCGIAALAWWGWTSGGGGPAGAVLALVAAGVLVVAWALVVAPKASNAIPQRTRMLIGTGLLLGCAALLAIAGQPGAAAVFAVVDVANTIWLLLAGGPEEILHADRAADSSRRG
jgi:hypothetical protein